MVFISAAETIIIPQENANPKNSWGIEKNLLLRGYITDKPRPIRAMYRVKIFIQSNKEAERNNRIVNNIKASFGLTKPVTRGLSFVRSTSPSKFLSK